MVQRCLQKCKSVSHCLEAFLLAHLLWHCLKWKKKKHWTTNAESREWKAFLTGVMKLMVATKNRAVIPQSPQGAGGRWMKGKAGMMVNQSEACCSRLRPGSTASQGEKRLAHQHCHFIWQWQAMHVSTKRVWLPILHPPQSCVTAVLSQSSSAVHLHCHGSEVNKIQPLNLFVWFIACSVSRWSSWLLQHAERKLQKKHKYHD